MDVSRGHRYSWFGRFYNAELNDRQVQSEIATFLTDLVRRLQSQLALQTAKLPRTEKVALRKIRLRQAHFRGRVEDMWHRQCAVTGSDQLEILRASHIKPWAHSTRLEQVDPNNGLLLSAIYDVLFDNGLITFSDNGRMRVSKRVRDRKRLGITPKASLKHRPTPSQAKFLQWHRRYVFDGGEVVSLQ